MNSYDIDRLERASLIADRVLRTLEVIYEHGFGSALEEGNFYDALEAMRHLVSELNRLAVQTKQRRAP